MLQMILPSIPKEIRPSGWRGRIGGLMEKNLELAEMRVLVAQLQGRIEELRHLTQQQHQRWTEERETLADRSDGRK
jgi:hypothetical protein